MCLTTSGFGPNLVLRSARPAVSGLIKLIARGTYGGASPLPDNTSGTIPYLTVLNRPVTTDLTSGHSLLGQVTCADFQGS